VGEEALRNLDEIIKESDGIVIARGDLGISLPIYKVPIFQKEIISGQCLKIMVFLLCFLFCSFIF